MKKLFSTSIMSRMALLLAGGVLTGLVSHGALAAEAKNVKMVVTAAFVSNNGMPVYKKMATYLGDKLGWKVEVVSGLSYAQSDDMLDKGAIQIGFVCGLPYTHKFSEGKYTLVAIPVMSLKKGVFADANGYEKVPGKYYSYTIVRKDSPIKSWADLKGKTYAYNDQGSNSGYNLPRAKLVALGAKSWEDQFSKVVVSGSHEESIRLVSKGIVDASSVDSLVLDYDRSIKDADAMNVKIIEHLGPAGAPPIVASRKADPAVISALRDALLNMHNDPKGRQILKEALVTRFDAPNDKNYDDIRAAEKKAKDAGFRDHKG